MMLTSCSNGNGGKVDTKSVIDCYSVQVKGDSSSNSFSGTYNVSVTAVCEYKSEDGKTIYCDEIGYSSLNVYENKYSSQYTVYSKTKLIGYLTKETNYYLNLEDRIIDTEIKWSENKYDEYKKEGVDNREAYEKAKSGYLAYDGYSNIYSSIRLDLMDKSLERHSYFKIGDGSSVSFKAKWF